MRIHITYGKNHSDRYAILSKQALDTLIEYWFAYGRPTGYLFPKQRDSSKPIDTFYLSRHIAKHEAELEWPNRFTCHSFWHAFGTHLYENGVDLMTIKTLLGHKSLESTTTYVHLAVSGKHTATSPFDSLMGGDGHERFKIQQVWNCSYADFSEHHIQSQEQLKTSHAIQNCKTGMLGATISQCTDCGHIKYHNNSCRNRNCTNCQAVKKELWVDKRRAEVIDSPYFHMLSVRQQGNSIFPHLHPAVYLPAFRNLLFSIFPIYYPLTSRNCT